MHGGSTRRAPRLLLKQPDHAIVVIPKRPFLDWLHSVDPTSTHLALVDLGQDPSIYLVGEWESDQDFIAQLREMLRVIFEDQLDGWWKERNVWPRCPVSFSGAGSR